MFDVLKDFILDFFLQTAQSPSTSKTLFRALALNVFSNLLLYAGHLIIARRLLAEDFATFTVVVSFVSLFSLFADLGATSLFIRKFAEAGARAEAGGEDTRGELLGSLLGFRIILALIVSAAVLVIAPLLGYSSEMRHLMMIMLVILFISSRIPIVRTVGESFLRGSNKYPLVALFAGVDALVFAGVLFFYSGTVLDLEDAVWIYAFCNVPGFILLCGVIYRLAKLSGFHLRFRFSAIKGILREGIPLIFNTIFLAVHNYADPLLLDKLSTPLQVSAYAAGMRVMSALIFLPIVFSAVISPIVTRAVVKKEMDHIRQLLDRSFRLLIILAIFIALVISSAPDSIIQILFGMNKYQEAAPIITLFGWSFIPIFFGNFMMEIAIAEGKLWLSTLYMGVLMAAAVLFDLLLIPHYGAFGSAIAKTIAVTSGAIVLFAFSKKMNVIDRKIFLGFIIKIIMILGGLIAFRYFLVSLGINEILIAGIVCAIFSLLALLSKAVQLSEIRLFTNAIFNRSK